MRAITIHLSDEDYRLTEQYADANGISIERLVTAGILCNNNIFVAAVTNPELLEPLMDAVRSSGYITDRVLKRTEDYLRDSYDRGSDDKGESCHH